MSTDAPLRALLAHQRERALAFGEFHAAFGEFVASKDRAAYDAFCAQLTPRFAKLSAAVNAIEAELRQLGAASLADSVRQLQQHEKTHLESTIRIQTWSTKYLVDDDDEYNATFVAAVRAERKDVLAARESVSEILTHIDDLLDSGCERE